MSIFYFQRMSLPSILSGFWNPLSIGTFKINCNASYPGSGDSVSFACAIRDCNGSWQMGSLQEITRIATDLATDLATDSGGC